MSDAIYRPLTVPADTSEPPFDADAVLLSLVRAARGLKRRPMEARLQPLVFWRLVLALNAKVGLSESEGVEWFQVYTLYGICALVCDPEGWSQ